MGGMLLCLYLTTHQTGLENDSSCTALGKSFSRSYVKKYLNKKVHFSALFTYFFTLTSFGWMSVMSYNIMSQFR